MAEPAVQTPTLDANPNAGLGFDDSKMGQVTSKLADIKRSEIGANEKIYGDLENLTSKGTAKLEQLSEKAGVEAEKMKPWDEEHEAAKRQTDPIQAFGSLGSVFGILASAFTHAPMENALNASAAAMNAIKAGNKEDYDRAHKAWEDNTKQALDRWKIEHSAFEDASSLLKTNMEAANIKMRVNAARFGDQKALAMLDAGMDKELFEYQAAKQKLALEMAENLPKVTMANAEMSRLFALGYNPAKPGDPSSQEALVKFQKERADLKRSEHATSSNPTSMALGRFLAENPDATPDQISAYLRTLKGPSDAKLEGGANRQAEIERHNKAMEVIGAKKAEGGGGASNLTTDRQRAQDVAAFRQKLRAEETEDGKPKWSSEEIADKAARYEHDLKTKAAAPSGNKVDAIKSQEGKIDVAESTIKNIDEMLLKHKAITGIGGKITRTGEAVGNILGSSATDRAQFRRWVLELQEILPSVLNDRNGKPLSSEASKIEGIIAGLAAGDTNANTLRAYDELRPLLKTIKKQLQERRGEHGDAAPEKAAGGNPWDKDPVVQ